ncbi:hypothetical protein T484DRAFT_2827841 [Baffinella frigidus]|nr:hypothetical protein T484DRAFT_2827841 [Cryptophyta sp. CCMP2293]
MPWKSGVWPARTVAVGPNSSSVRSGPTHPVCREPRGCSAVGCRLSAVACRVQADSRGTFRARPRQPSAKCTPSLGKAWDRPVSGMA